MLTLLQSRYSGLAKKVELMLYDDETNNFKFEEDNSGYLPYVLTLPEIDVPRNGYIKKIDHVGKYDLVKDEDIFMQKIYLTVPTDAVDIREQITTWESNIKFHENYLYDKQLICGTPRKATADDESESMEQFWLSLLSLPIPKLRRLAIDIEVMNKGNILPNPETAPEQVIAISLRGSDGFQGTYVLEHGQSEEIPNVWFYSQEKNLLEDVFKKIKEYPILLTFNGDAFDCPYLHNRAMKFHLDSPFIIQKDKVTLRHGVHIDLHLFFKIRSIQIYAFSNKYQAHDLDTIAQGLIQKGKIKSEKLIGDMSYEELVKYNKNDVDLTYELSAFNNDLVIRLIITIMRISKLGIEEVTRLTIAEWIRSLFIYYHRKWNYLIPNQNDLTIKGGAASTAMIEGKKYQGAIVMLPTSGIHFNVDVIDGASLYPTIVEKQNISYETVNCPHSECKINVPTDLPHWICTKRKGLTSLLIGSLKNVRVKQFKKFAKDKTRPKDEQEFYGVIEQAIKVFMNAAYGVLGFESFQLYVAPAAELVTAFDRTIMTDLIKYCSEYG